MVPQPLTLGPIVTFATVTQVNLIWKENLRHRVGGAVIGVKSNTAVPSSITDDQGNVYSIVTNTNQAGVNFTSIWYCPLIRGTPQRTFVKFGSSQATVYVGGIFYDQPLLNVASGTESANTTAATIGPLAAKSGEEVLFGVYASSNLTAGVTPTGFSVLFQDTLVSMVYGQGPQHKIVWASSPGAGGCACLASFRAVPLATFQWAFDPITKFTGFTPPPTVNVSWSDTLTWTETDVLVSVDAFLADTLTWTDNQILVEDDENPLTDTLTWSETYSLAVDASLADTLTFTGTEILVSTDAPIGDTLTWTGTEILVEDDEVPLTDTVTFTDEFDAVEADASVADTLTWTDSATVELEQDDTLTWADSTIVAGYDWSIGDTLTWSDVAVPAGADAFTADTLTWTDAAAVVSTDIKLADTLTWSQAFFLETDVALADTLTFTDLDRVIDDGDMPDDTLTFTDEFDGLPEIEALLSDLLLFADSYENDFQAVDSVTWLDSFFFDGETFPDANASWADTLTWDMEPQMELTIVDRLTWTDAMTLPDPTVNMGDTLTWASVFGADQNLLGVGRYRR